MFKRPPLSAASRPRKTLAGILFGSLCLLHRARVIDHDKRYSYPHQACARRCRNRRAAGLAVRATAPQQVTS